MAIDKKVLRIKELVKLYIDSFKLGNVDVHRVGDKNYFINFCLSKFNNYIDVITLMRDDDTLKIRYNISFNSHIYMDFLSENYSILEREDF